MQKIIGLRKENLAEATPNADGLGDWFINDFNLDGRNTFIFMSEATLLSFVLFQGKKPVTLESLPNMFLAGLMQLLQMKGLPQSTVDQVLDHAETGLYTKTDSRAALGSMNDLVLHYQWRVESNGGLARCDLTDIIMSINDMPQRRLGWQTSWEAVHGKLGLTPKH